MKHLVFFLAITLIFSSCKTHEAATYEGIENVKMVDIDNQEIRISADIKFHNPNHLGGTVTNTDIDVLFEGTNVAKLVNTYEFDIPSTDYFSVPMEATIPLDAIRDQNNLLGGITGLLINKKIDFGFQGSLVFDFKVLEYTYEINESKTVKLGKARN